MAIAGFAATVVELRFVKSLTRVALAEFVRIPTVGSNSLNSHEFSYGSAARSKNRLLSVTGLLVLVLFGSGAWSQSADAQSRPNVLWITCEDMSPSLGCYGDDYAATPNIDRLAGESIRYTHAFATAPVCSAARSCLITGLYATSLGTQNLRSTFSIPNWVHGFPSYLRQNGYYCTNNVKTDYNTADEQRLIAESWDESSARAHWRGRQPGQPFFSVFNLMETHQSRANVWPAEQFEREIGDRLNRSDRHDPAQAPVPPYYPDTPTVRRTLARYYDCISVMDQKVGRILDELKQDGLEGETVVFFYSDHGMGMPRGKRTLYDSGLQVPLLIRFPEKYQHLAPGEPGTTVDRLVSFVDFAPTMLTLLGVSVPDYMQGVPFLGESDRSPRDYVFGARDRVDEAYDLSRCVRDKQYLYVRNYLPHLSLNQPEGYSDNAEMRREITRLAAEGKLNAAQLTYAGPTRPIEELYDTTTDPHQIHNLISSPEHRDVLNRLRNRLQQWELETRDLGFLPEWEVRQRSSGTTPWETAREAGKYDLTRIMSAASLVGRHGAAEEQAQLLSADDSAVRFWAAVGLNAAGAKAASAVPALLDALDDTSPLVRIEAAGILMYWGEEAALKVLTTELDGPQLDAALYATRTLQLLGKQARPALPDLKRALSRASEHKDEDQYLYFWFSLNASIESLEQNGGE